MTRDQFISGLTLDEEGHYPFQMVSNKKDGTVEMGALCLTDIHDVYAQAKKAIEGSDTLFFSVDFPAGLMDTDFVCVFSMVDAKWSTEVFPYKGVEFIEAQGLDVANAEAACERLLEDFIWFIANR